MDMSFKNGFNSSKLDKIMSPEQFDQVVEAILAGKYSWACVLILRFAGYNPLHYIPYRTYNRLMKDNRQGSRLKKHQTNSMDTDQKPSPLKTGRPIPDSRSSQITDLSYLETANRRAAEAQGGAVATLLTDLNPLMGELGQDKPLENSFLYRLDLDLDPLGC